MYEGTKCLLAASLSFSAGCLPSSYSAETYAILRAVEWCTVFLTPRYLPSIPSPYSLTLNLS